MSKALSPKAARPESQSHSSRKQIKQITTRNCGQTERTSAPSWMSAVTVLRLCVAATCSRRVRRLHGTPCRRQWTGALPARRVQTSMMIWGAVLSWCRPHVVLHRRDMLAPCRVNSGRREQPLIVYYL